jgi:rubrerythrin
MTVKEFNDILDFAVEREKEAVQFYNDLQVMADFKDQKEFLLELENMEKGHITVIENLRKKQPSEMEIKQVTNLRISEYLVVDADKLNLNYQNILIRAMKREEMSFKLYTDMSQKMPDTELSKLFYKLANEEAAHKLKFEKLYDEWLSQGN